jgi:NADPH-dependent ferric siderophore reductase
VLDHDSGGPGVSWARQLRTGDRVSFSGPEGSFVLRDGAYHVFAGDETAAVAFGQMLRAVPAGAGVYGVIEAGEAADRLPLDRALNWQYRNGRPAAGSQTLLEALRRLQLPSKPGVAYLAGEARTIQLLRRHLVTERQWPRQAVRTKPFWTPAKRGLD